MGCRNYNQIEIETCLIGTLERVPSQENTNKASQNAFLRSHHNFTKFPVI